jgi:hypothetical protein
VRTGWPGCGLGIGIWAGGSAYEDERERLRLGCVLRIGRWRDGVVHGTCREVEAGDWAG